MRHVSPLSVVALVVVSVVVAGLAAGATHEAQVGDSVPSFDPGEVLTNPEVAVGVAVGAAALGVGAWLAFRGGAKFVTRENVLENETRASLYEFLEDKPGTHLRGIAEQLDLSTTNVLWHLRKLEDADLVKGKKLEGYKVFYPVKDGESGQRKAMAMSVLRNENARGILEYVAVEPGAHQRQIARALDVNHGTVRWHLRKMIKTDLVDKIERDHAIQYYVSEFGADVLAEEAGMDVQVTGPGEGEAASA